MTYHDKVKDAARTGLRAKVLHMADGGRVVSPYSLRGMANAISSGVAAIAKPFSTPAGYEPAVVAAPAPAPVVAAPAAPPATPQLGGVNMNALQRREAAAGLRDGGPVHGPGTHTSDSIPARLSKDEYVLPADTALQIGHEKLDAIVDATHTPAKEQKRGMRAYADGGLVEPFMRGTRAVMRGAGEDISGAVKRGAYGEAAGHALRGTAAMFPAVAEDVLGGPGRALATATQGVAPNTNVLDQAKAAINTFATGDANTSPQLPSLGLRSAQAATVPNVPTASAAPTPATGYGVSTIGGTDEGLARTARAVQIQREMADIQNGQDQSGVMSNGPGMRVVGGSSFFRTADQEPKNQIDTRGLSQRQIANLQNQRGIAEDSNATSRANNRDSNAQARANAELSARVGLRGQDMSAKTAAASARAEQMNKDRQFGLDAEKFGHEKAKANFEQREKAIKDVHTEIGNMLPPGPDGKPDMVTAARYAEGLTAQVGAMQADLEKRAAAGDSKAASQLKVIQEKGLAALDAKDKARFIAGMKAKEAAEANSTGMLNPTGGTAVNDPRPVGSLRKTSDGFLGFGGEYTTDRGDTIPARVIERDGSYFGGLRNRYYDPLITK